MAKPTKPDAAAPIDPNLPADPQPAAPASEEPAEIDLSQYAQPEMAIPKPVSTTEIELPSDPTGYKILSSRGLFSLTRLFVENAMNFPPRQLCVPVNMDKNDWLVLLEKAPDGRPLERIKKAIIENYRESDRDLILSMQRRPLWSVMQRAGRRLAGESYGFAAGFDPLARGDQHGALPADAMAGMDMMLNGPATPAAVG